MCRWTTVAVLGLLLFLVGSAPPQGVEERWGIRSISKERFSHLHTTKRTVEEDGRKLTETVWENVRRSISRDEGPDFRRTTTWETEDGRLVRFHAVVNEDQGPRETFGEQRGGKWIVYHKDHRAPRVTCMPEPLEVLGPRGVEKLLREKGGTKGTSFKAWAIEEFGGGFEEQSHTVRGPEEVEIFGKRTTLTRMDRGSMIGGRLEEFNRVRIWVDAEGRVVREASMDGRHVTVWGPREKVEPEKEGAPGKPRPMGFDHLAREGGGRVLQGHGDWARSVAFAPDGERIASAGDDGTVRIWDAASGREVSVLTGHEGWVFAAAFHPEGRLIASAGRDGNVRIWDASKGKLVRAIDGEGTWITWLAFAPDGNRLAAAGGDGTIRIWDIEEGKRTGVLEGHTGWVESIAYAPDGKSIASGSRDDTIRIWSVETGKTIREILVKRGEIYAQAAPRVAFRPDGEALACAVGVFIGHARILPLEGGGEPRLLETKYQSASVIAFAPDGKSVVTGHMMGELILWDLGEASKKRVIGQHGAVVLSVAFAPDGSRIVSSGADGLIKLWDLEPTTAAEGEISGEKGKEVAEGPEGPWKVQTFHPGKDLIGGDSVGPIAYAADSKTLVAAIDETIKVLDAEEGWDRVAIPEQPESITAVALAPDGKTLAFGDWEGRVALGDIAEGRVDKELGPLVRPASCLAFSPDGKTLAAVGHDDVVKLFDVKEGKDLRTIGIGAGGISSVAFSPEGDRLVSGSIGKPIRIWDASTGEAIRTFSKASSGAESVVFTPDGKRIASGGPLKRVRIWDVETGEEAKFLGEHTDLVRRIAISPNGALLAVAGNDGKVTVWAVESGDVAQRLVASDQWIRAIAFRPDGKALAASCGSMGVKVWSIP